MIWDIRKKVLGDKKFENQSMAIINPRTGKLALTKKEIKQVTLNYCKETLLNNKPEKGFENDIEKKKKEAKNILQSIDGTFKAKVLTFRNMLKKFKDSRKRSYHFITKAGKMFQEVIFNMCQKMFSNEMFPNEFQNTILHMIFKGKGRRENLSDNRFIHCKDWFARVAEGLVVEDGLKKPLISGSSIYQIGGQPGHRPEELVFVLKSIVARYLSQGKSVIIQCYDVQKYFDKEMIEDAILTCTKRGVDKKAIRIWYKLNENTVIQVKTSGAGLSAPGKVGAVIGQGTIGGALISQAVLDDGVMEHFSPAGNQQLQYGSVPLAPFMYQDDLLNGVEDLNQARETNNKVDQIMKQHGLTLNEEKSIVLVIGTKKQKGKISDEIKSKPLMCGHFETKEKQSEKWLGQLLSAAGLADSVKITVDARMGKIKGAAHEIAHIVNDWRSQAVGGMASSILLWEACCISSLLNGAGTWVEISSETENKLNSLQRWFIRLILQVPPGTPVASILWDVGMLDMGLRIWREKLMLALHIRSLGDDTLAGKVYQEQKENKWPGLVKETEIICKKLEIENVHTTKKKKKLYRKIVTKACHKENEKRLRKQAEGKSKCTRIDKEAYGKKDYIINKDIKSVREIFRTRFGMMPFAGNYSRDCRFARTEWLCRCQKAREDESHLISGECEVFGTLRKKYDNLEDDENLVNFFNEILEMRDKLDEDKSL